MVVLAISLLTILTGTLLLAKFKKDQSGKLFTCISWFFIVVGCLLFLGAIAMGICRVTNKTFPCQPAFQQEMMIKKCCPGMQDPAYFHPGMDKKGPCCPQGMDRGMCPRHPGCMKQDSTMKHCPKHMMKCDSAKLQAPK